MPISESVLSQVVKTKDAQNLSLRRLRSPTGSRRSRDMEAWFSDQCFVFSGEHKDVLFS